MPNTFPTSVLTLGSLQEIDTPALLDLHHLTQGLQGRDAFIVTEAFRQIQDSFNNVQETLRTKSPSLEYLEIDAADIGVLAVGSEFAPGEFTVYNGPPDFAPIGWIGSRDSTLAIALTSIVAGLVTTATDHALKVGDHVYIEATTDPQNQGFYIVATTPTITTYTVTGGVDGGNSTGGTSTLQYQGGWLAMFAVGGTSPEDAPFRVDVDGTFEIDNATFTLTSPDGTIVLDPTRPSITVADADGNVWATLEILAESPQTITAATNASPSVVTIVGHGYVDGDTVVIAGAIGNTAINGYRILNVLTADTFSMTTIAGVAVNGSGAYTGGGTAKRYYGGGLFQTMAIGESFDDYKLRAFADGSLKIRNADILLTGTGGTIALDPIDPIIRIVGTPSGDTITIDPTDNFKFVDGAGLFNFQLGKDIPGPAGSVIRGAVFDGSSDLVLGTITSGGTLPATFGVTVICYGTATDHSVLDVGGLAVYGHSGGLGGPTGSAYVEFDSIGFDGIQVIGPQVAAVVSPTVTTGNTVQTADAAYSANEQTMLNDLKAAVALLNGDVGALKTAIDSILNVFATHGLTS